MRRIQGHTAGFIVLVLVLLVFIGCVKEEDPEREEEKTETADDSRQRRVTETTKAQTERPERSLQIEMKDEEPVGEGAAQAEQAEKLPVLGKEFLLVRQGPAVIVPEDMVIGKLQHAFTGEAERQDVYVTVDTFLSYLAEGKIAERTIAPEWRTAIYRSLVFHLERKTIPERYRIGEVRIAEGRGSTNVRLISGTGRTGGEILLEPIDGSWLITEIQLDLHELTEPYETPEPYEPQVYRWLNQY